MISSLIITIIVVNELDKNHVLIVWIKIEINSKLAKSLFAVCFIKLGHPRPLLL